MKTGQQSSVLWVWSSRTHTLTRRCTHTHTHINTQTHTSTQTKKHRSRYRHTHMHTHLYRDTYTKTHTDTHAHTLTQRCIHRNTHRHTHSVWGQKQTDRDGGNAQKLLTMEATNLIPDFQNPSSFSLSPCWLSKVHHFASSVLWCRAYGRAVGDFTCW